MLSELAASGVFKPEEAFALIQDLFFSIDPMTRRNAIRALAMFRLTDPVKELLAQAEEDSDPEVREAAKVTRLAIKDAAVDALVGGLF